MPKTIDLASVQKFEKIIGYKADYELDTKLLKGILGYKPKSEKILELQNSFSRTLTYYRRNIDIHAQ